MKRITLEGLRVVVTGASSGIGRALVRELIAEGAVVLAVARRRERVEQLASELSGGKQRVVPLVGDVTDAEVRKQIVDAARREWGGLDALVNNAGTSVQGDFASGNEQQFRRIFEVNFFAAVELTRLMLPLLRESPRATIVNVASILGHRATPFNAEYCASKFALRGWSESLRAELAISRVHVLVVSPGTTDTEFFDSVLEKRREMPWVQRNGVSPVSVALATVRAIKARRNEVTPHFAGKMLVLANRLAPRLVDRIMRHLAKR